MAKINRLAVFLLVILQASLSIQAAEKTTKLADVEYYQPDDVTNQIPYFDNRLELML